MKLNYLKFLIDIFSMKNNFNFTIDVKAFNDSVIPKIIEKEDNVPIKKKKKKRCKVCRKKKMFS